MASIITREEKGKALLFGEMDYNLDAINKNVYLADREPNEYDDISHNFSINSIWCYNNNAWQCKNNSLGVAEWIKISFTGNYGSNTKAENENELTYGNASEKGFSTVISYNCKTTDATKTTLNSTPITTNGSTSFEFFNYTFIATRDDNSEVWARSGSFTVKRDDSSCTIENESGTDIVKDVSDWKLEFEADGNNFNVKVTGQDDKTIIWVIDFKKDIIYL